MRVLLADDHPIVRQGVRELLEKGGHVVVGEATDGHEALRLARTLRPEISVLDLSMPKMNGIDTAREMRRQLPGIKTMLLTMHASRDYVLKALKAGARGYVLKDQAPDDLLRAIREVARGKLYLSPGIDAYVVDAYLDDARAEEDPLTPRERQVLQLIAEGHTTKEVAHVLNIGFKTAESHRHHIMKKLEIHDVTGLVRYAIHRGLVHL